MKNKIFLVWLAVLFSWAIFSDSFAQEEGHEKGAHKEPQKESKKEPPKEKSPIDGYVTITLSPQKQQFIGVKTGSVERKKAAKTIRAAGRVAYDPDLYQAQSEYIQAIRSLKETPVGTDGKSAEWAQKLIESSKMRLLSMGFNEELTASLDNQESPDKSLLYAVPDGDAWVYASVYEYEEPLIKVGQKLKVEISSDGGHILEGYVRAIDKIVDPQTRTVRIRVNVKNDGSLKPDLYVNVLIDVDLGEAIFVPEDAIFITGKANIVFVDKGEGVYEPRHVVLGTKVDDDYEIKEGLKEGEKVVTNGNFMLDAESRLKAALGAMGHKHGG